MTNTTTPLPKLDTFTQAYLICALCSSTNDEDDPLDQTYDVADIDPDALNAAIQDCAYFRMTYLPLFRQNEEQAGYEYWLSRNSHGSGYFDGAYTSTVADILQKAARKRGTRNLYISDNGKIHGF